MRTWLSLFFVFTWRYEVNANYDDNYGGGNTRTGSTPSERTMIYLPNPEKTVLQSLITYPRSNIKYPIYLAKQANKYGHETDAVLGLLVQVKSAGGMQTSGNYRKTQNYQNKKQCKLPDGSPSLFLESSEQLVEDYTDGARQPLPNSCPRCGYGTQLSYSPVNPRYDLSDMKTGVILNLVPGGFRCKDNKNLCVHGMDGSRYVSASGNTVIWPVPYCKGSSCSMLLTLDPTEAVNEYRGKRVERGTDELKDKNNVIYYNGNEYNYIEMKAITCGGCDKTLNMCYSIDSGSSSGEIKTDYTSRGSTGYESNQRSETSSDACLETTGYTYEGGRPLPADAYDNAQASATEEQYSSLGYGDNTQYIQPDGVNPYADETNSPSPTPTNNGYEQQLSNAPSQPLSDSPASRAQLIARLNAANRRLVQTRTNVRTLQTQVAVQRARAQTALQTARAIGRPTINVRPANVNVKVNANPRITNVNQNQLTAEQRAQQAANTGGSPAPTGSPSSPAPAGSPSTSVAALRMHSPVIDEKHFVDLTGKAEKPSEEMLSMIEQQNENFLLGGKSTIKIAQPNILWKVRRESNSAVIREKKTMRDDTQESVGGTNSDLLFSLLGDKASLTGPPGQEPSLQWISSHRTMRR